jgi:Tfp pilus assembly protein PilF
LHQSNASEDALIDLNKVLRREQNNVLALAARGDIFRVQGELKDALIDLEKALDIQPNHIVALVARSKIYRRQKKI